MMFLSKNWYFSVQKALIYYTVNKSHHNSFILLVFSPVANFRYVANFRFLTLDVPQVLIFPLLIDGFYKQKETFMCVKGLRIAFHPLCEMQI